MKYKNRKNHTGPSFGVAFFCHKIAGIQIYMYKGFSEGGERQGKMGKNSSFLILVAVILAASTASCGAFSRIRGYSEKEYEVITVSDAGRLEDRSFYVEKADGSFDQLYLGETSYRTGSVPKAPDSGRVAWFGKDYARIPTMYRGERIAFRSSEEFEEEFLIERFEDIGYTIGICNMKESSTGRYRFSTRPDDMQIDIKASTGELYQLGEHRAVIERIGDVELRSGNISRAGTVVGLEKERIYPTDVYIGTDVKKYEFAADVRALVSMEVLYISDYAFMQGNTVTFSFPVWYNSGYYCVGGYGFVRYVAADREYDEEPDMNIPNSGPEYSGEERDGEEERDPAAERIPFRIDREGPVGIEVMYEGGEGQEETAGRVLPSARVISETAVYALSPRGNGLLSVETVLPPGDYVLEITGLEGRKYTYKVMEKGGE